jgi:hypothetical protein
MNSTIKLLAVFIVIIALVCPALAQPGGGGMGPGRGMGPRMYNPQTVVTVKGQVASLENLPPMGRRAGRGMGVAQVAAVLKTEQGNLRVHLGPGWYLEQEGVALKAGDTLEVTGSNVTVGQQPTIIAKDIQVNGKTLNLRDEQGLPLWRGMGPGQAPSK